jgi:hypothetical protein
MLPGRMPMQWRHLNGMTNSEAWKLLEDTVASPLIRRATKHGFPQLIFWLAIAHKIKWLMQDLRTLPAFRAA